MKTTNIKVKCSCGCGDEATLEPMSLPGKIEYILEKFYYVDDYDIEDATTDILSIFQPGSSIEEIIDKRITLHEEFAGKSLNEILRLQREILFGVNKLHQKNP